MSDSIEKSKSSVLSNTYAKNPELFNTHLLEQYKLYVEMTDRISARRHTTNVYFLTIHSTIVTTASILANNSVEFQSNYLALIPLITTLILCALWGWLLQSYRKINETKFKVIGMMEKQLPYSPYWQAEWTELGFGNNRRKYYPISNIETFIPILFAVFYVIIWINLVLAP